MVFKSGKFPRKFVSFDVLTYTELQGLIYMSLNFFRLISSLSVEKGQRIAIR